MALFRKTREQIAEREAGRREKAFAKTPAGQAKAAREAGDRTFQILLTLSETTGRTEAMSRAYATTATTEHGTSIDLIEAEGWKLEHAGYVYRQTGSVSRDKFFSSGHQEAVHGEIVGVYIFRISENEDTTGDAGRPER